jgi:hypothetical protein
VTFVPVVALNSHGVEFGLAVPLSCIAIQNQTYYLAVFFIAAASQSVALSI